MRALEVRRFPPLERASPEAIHRQIGDISNGVDRMLRALLDNEVVVDVPATLVQARNASELEGERVQGARGVIRYRVFGPAVTSLDGGVVYWTKESTSSTARRAPTASSCRVPTSSTA